MTWTVFSEGCYWITYDELGRTKRRVTSPVTLNTEHYVKY